jgi:ABC-type dipeptide/oligopeptide/nickel transport system permease subunit
MANATDSSPELPQAPALAMPRLPRSPGWDMLRRLSRNRSGMTGIAILVFLVLVAIFAQQIAPFDPIKPLKGVTRRAGPCLHLLGCPAGQPEHIFGIDGNNRDLFSRIIFGTRWSLIVGIGSVTSAILIGAILGAVAGYLGGWAETIIMRTMDVMLAFPSLLLALAVVTILPPEVRKMLGALTSLVAIAIVDIPQFARIVRASVISVKELDFVAADRALGASDFRILVHRIMPNALTPLIVRGTLGIATAILDAAALSFLGLGAPPPTPEWGLMLGEERNSVFNAPHLVFLPGLGIMLIVLAFNLLGDGLRDALDPRLSNVGIKVKDE